MNIFIYYILPFVVVLGVLIFFHELGHFLVAKYFNVKILKFSLGFGPKLVGKKIGETDYLISLVPLGGYVKMLGENIEEEEEPLTPEEEARSFGNQHVLKRIFIVAAGPLFNLILALVTFCCFYMIAGNQVMVPEIGEIRQNSPAFNAGFLKGDIIVSVGDKRTDAWSDVKAIIEHSSGKALEVTVKRLDRLIVLNVRPEPAKVKNIFGEDVEAALIGIVASGRLEFIDLSPLRAIREGFFKTWEVTKLTCLTIVKLIQRVIPIETIGGPILIGQMTGHLAKESFISLIPFMAVISINLGILNLLPIPILDGGLIIFLLVELIIGKPLSVKMRENAQKAGLIILILLMVFVFYNDVIRLMQ
ncbi:MAG TPA: RIP metalloprotease RseP [Desulfobacteraceae bacterium]|nr:RIP metalloprotease RseP [Desulfobacteraceae bacterium]HPJ68244.1 RIP metalloprotease RseP [Desulfobacteraceae bacterium]